MAPDSGLFFPAPKATQLGSESRGPPGKETCARVHATSADLQISEISGAKQGNVETHRAVLAQESQGAEKRVTVGEKGPPLISRPPNLESPDAISECSRSRFSIGEGGV